MNAPFCFGSFPLAMFLVFFPTSGPTICSFIVIHYWVGKSHLGKIIPLQLCFSVLSITSFGQVILQNDLPPKMISISNVGRSTEKKWNMVKCTLIHLTVQSQQSLTYALNNMLCLDYKRQPASRAHNKQQQWQRQLQQFVMNACMHFWLKMKANWQTGFGCKGKSDSLLFMVFSRQVFSFAPLYLSCFELRVRDFDSICKNNHHHSSKSM